MKRALLLVMMCSMALTMGCTRRERGEIGSATNPIKLFFVPSVDVKVIEDTSSVLEKYLEEHTPYKFKVSIPTSFIAVVEAFGTKRADVASINTFGYLLAHEKYGAQARLTVIRYGESSYKAQFLARADGPIKKLEDLNNKTIAYVDPSSTSGYLMPLKVLKDRQIKPKDNMFAMRHDNVVSMIYQGQVDAGATFYSPKADGEIQDARRLVKTQYPDVEEKVKILELTESIPNDPVVFRKDLPEEVKNNIVKALEDFVQTEEGRDTFLKLSSVTGFIRATDEDYAPVVKMLKDLGKSATEMVNQ
ncbi:MAG: phosphate/phosphite/phosphonate ABC transporter substrate-binding protein [Bdellovibrionaceae bacterium]|nr:phosphate/phosphite/phosphonate ABC transporter substrate-binding protein [Pseudobdellovibrionaceae bacterium]